MSSADDVAIAKDGLRARVSGRYAEDKLQFLDDYLPPAWKATEAKSKRWFVDLFAGPGWNVDKTNHAREFSGSPYRAVTTHYGESLTHRCTNAVFVNLDRLDHEALDARVNAWCKDRRSLVPRSQIAVIHGDANEHLRHILKKIHPLEYAFVFADILGPTNLPWHTVELLRQRHKSVDFYVLFPFEMGIKRLIGYDKSHTAKNARLLNAYFGTDEWRPLCEKRRTDAESPALSNALVDLYLLKLRGLWKYADEQKRINATGDRTLYRMLFATDNDVGAKLAGWERGDKRKDQLSLL